MMGQNGGNQNRLFYSFNLEDHVPANHLLRGIDECLDLTELRAHLAGTLRAREAAALTATARWCLTAALHRRESRGIHTREEFPALAPHLAMRQILRGLDQIESNFTSAEELAA